MLIYKNKKNSLGCYHGPRHRKSIINLSLSHSSSSRINPCISSKKPKCQIPRLASLLLGYRTFLTKHPYRMDPLLRRPFLHCHLHYLVSLQSHLCSQSMERRKLWSPPSGKTRQKSSQVNRKSFSFPRLRFIKTKIFPFCRERLWQILIFEKSMQPLSG